MGYRIKRPAAPERPPAPPPIPTELVIYEPLDWLEPGEPVKPPADGYDVAAWIRWQGAHLAAYQRHLAARRAWIAVHGDYPLDLAAAVPDEPWCGELAGTIVRNDTATRASQIPNHVAPRE